MRRESLTPPDENRVSWEDYINAEPGEYPTIGRQLVYKESSKTFRATVAMVNLILFKRNKMILFKHKSFNAIICFVPEQRFSINC